MNTISKLYKYISPRKCEDSGLDKGTVFHVSRFALTCRFSLLLLLIVIIPMFVTSWWIEEGYLMPGENAYVAIPLFLLILIVPCARLLSNLVINKDLETINKFCLEIKKGNYKVHFHIGHEKEDEEPFVVLLRNLTWMSHSLDARQKKTRGRLQRVQSEHRIMKAKALLDGLTGLYNRRYFEDVLPKRLEHAASEGTEISLIFIDCDKFKQLNDTLGHQAGDQALEKLAESIRGAIRLDGDIPFRFGGDEFAVLLQDVGVETAVTIANRIRTIFLDNRVGEVTLSLGVATALPAGDLSDGRLMKRLIKVADKQTYRAKENGGDNVCAADFVITNDSVEG